MTRPSTWISGIIAPNAAKSRAHLGVKPDAPSRLANCYLGLPPWAIPIAHQAPWGDGESEKPRTPRVGASFRIGP